MSARADEAIGIGAYAETAIALKSGRSAYSLAGEVLESLLTTSGISREQIDGLWVTTPLSEASNPFFAVHAADALGLSPSWINLGGLGGCSALAGAARAVEAIRAGSCEIALVLSADAPSTQWRANYGGYRTEFQEPVGVQSPPASFGLLMNRYEHEFGLSYEALGKIAITQREHALRNPLACAKLRKPLTIAEYLASRMIAPPLRLLDSVMFCDGANAFLVMSESRARQLGLQRFAAITSYAERTHPGNTDPLASMTSTGFDHVAPRVLAKAGLQVGDIDMFQPYDDFTIAVLMQLEAFGFCDKGAGSQYVLDTDLSCSGTLPLNTGGGQIGAGQPGLASGGLNLAEAVRQLFQEGGERQVDAPRNALVTGIGVISYAANWGTSAAMILEN